MRKYHPATIKAVTNNLPKRLTEMERAIASENARDRTPDTLQDLTGDVGSITNGQVLALTAADPTEVEANGAFFDTEGVEFSDGELYHVGGVNEGRLMFGLRAEDGAGVFAGGEGVIDGDGIHLNGTRYALEHNAVSADGSQLRRARMEMITGNGNATKPPYLAISYANSYVNTNLITNGDFGTGDTTGWSAYTPSSLTFTALDVNGDYAGCLTRPDDGTTIFYAYQEAAATGDTYYEAALDTWAQGEGFWINVYVLFYDAGNVQIGAGSYIYNKSASSVTSTYILERTHASRVFRTPATTAKIRLVVQSFDGLAKASTIYFDNVELRKIDDYHELVFDDDGFSVIDWSASTTAGVDYDTSPSSSQAALLQELAVFKAIRATGMLLDVRNTGNYAVQLAGISPSGAVVILRTLWTGSVGAAGEQTITFTEPLVLTAGIHFLRVERTSGAATWWERNVPFSNGDFSMPRISRDGGGAWVTENVPFKLVYQPGAWS